MSFFELFKLEKDKSEQWMSPPFEKGQQNVHWKEKGMQRVGNGVLEREYLTSL